MSRLIAEFSGPPPDRMAGRAQARAARAQAKAGRTQGGNYTPKQKVSAATVARATSFLAREALLDAAVHQGVIVSGLRAHYSACYDADPEGTRSYLRSLGLRDGGTSAASATATSTEYPTAGLSHAERQRIAAAREGRTSRIVTGGL